MAKFIAIDADGLNVFFSGSDISFVKIHCRKENPPKQSKEIANFLKADLSASRIITLNTLCTSQFQLDLFFWEMDSSASMAVFNVNSTSKLSSLYLDKVSPPPRLALL